MLKSCLAQCVLQLMGAESPDGPTQQTEMDAVKNQESGPGGTRLHHRQKVLSAPLLPVVPRPRTLEMEAPAASSDHTTKLASKLK